MKFYNRTAAVMLSLLFIALLFAACKKDPATQPQDPGAKPPGEKPAPTTPADDVYHLKVRAVITIGNIAYDSIPAKLQITTWDASNAEHAKEIDMVAGSNNIDLPKSHLKFRLKINQWDVSDEVTLTREQLQEHMAITLGKHKDAKKLLSEETYLLVENAYIKQAKALYKYNTDGTLHTVTSYEKDANSPNLALSATDYFEYSGGRLTEIDRFDKDSKMFGFTDFTYTPQGQLIHMYQKVYDQHTAAAVAYQGNKVNVNYEFDNGKTMAYTITYQGGNNVEDRASSANGSESGNYTYDHNINPYAHMGWPDIYFSKQSRNNITGSEKNYSGGYPSADPYSYEYQYDAEGYPAEKVTSYRSYITRQLLYKTKKVYTYTN